MAGSVALITCRIAMGLGEVRPTLLCAEAMKLLHHEAVLG